MKVPAVLTQVFRRFCGYIGTPKSALDVSEAGRIRAIGGRLHSWVSLIIDIDSCATINSVTSLRTFASVISFKSVEALRTCPHWTTLAGSRSFGNTLWALVHSERWPAKIMIIIETASSGGSYRIHSIRVKSRNGIFVWARGR